MVICDLKAWINECDVGGCSREWEWILININAKCRRTLVHVNAWQDYKILPSPRCTQIHGVAHICKFGLHAFQFWA